MSDERLTTDEAIWYLESVVYEDFGPYTQKCLLNVIEAARKEESMTSDWEKRMERIVEKLEQQKSILTDWAEDLAFKIGIEEAIKIVKAGGVDETD